MTDAAKKFVFIRVNVAGFKGESISLKCAYDPGTDILALTMDGPYESGDAPAGFLRLTTQPQDQFRDMLFERDETRDAIAAFFEMRGLGLINLAPAVKRHDPGGFIEQDGMDERGVKYRFNDDISNGQVAVLLAAFVAQKQRQVQQMDDFLSQVFTTFG